MAELHPNYLDSVELNMGYQPTGLHKQVPEIPDIVDWIQCFGIYMAIISWSKPKRIEDLIGYQSIIVGLHSLAMRADGFSMTVVSGSRHLLFAPGSGLQLTSPSGTWHSQTGRSKVTQDKAVIFAQSLSVIPSINPAKTSLS